eukprot:jgi/Mesen1/7954/ME000422S07111
MSDTGTPKRRGRPPKKAKLEATRGEEADESQLATSSQSLPPSPNLSPAAQITAATNEQAYLAAGIQPGRSRGLRSKVSSSAKRAFAQRARVGQPAGGPDGNGLPAEKPGESAGAAAESHSEAAMEATAGGEALPPKAEEPVAESQVVGGGDPDPQGGEEVAREVGLGPTAEVAGYAESLPGGEGGPRQVTAAEAMEIDGRSGDAAPDTKEVRDGDNQMEPGPDVPALLEPSQERPDLAGPDLLQTNQREKVGAGAGTDMDRNEEGGEGDDELADVAAERLTSFEGLAEVAAAAVAEGTDDVEAGAESLARLRAEREHLNADMVAEDSPGVLARGAGGKVADSEEERDEVGREALEPPRGLGADSAEEALEEGVTGKPGGDEEEGVERAGATPRVVVPAVERESGAADEEATPGKTPEDGGAWEELVRAGGAVAEADEEAAAGARTGGREDDDVDAAAAAADADKAAGKRGRAKSEGGGVQSGSAVAGWRSGSAKRALRVRSSQPAEPEVEAEAAVEEEEEEEPEEGEGEGQPGAENLSAATSEGMGEEQQDEGYVPPVVLPKRRGRPAKKGSRAALGGANRATGGAVATDGVATERQGEVEGQVGSSLERKLSVRPPKRGRGRPPRVRTSPSPATPLPPAQPGASSAEAALALPPPGSLTRSHVSAREREQEELGQEEDGAREAALDAVVKSKSSSSSSGFIVAGRRVLTSAHCVEHQSQVKVKRRGCDTKYLATVLADDAFWSDVVPLQLGALPRLQDAVTVVGYPVGGDTISVTSGVVSRIESLKHEDVENIGYIIPTPVILHFTADVDRNGSYTGFPILGVEWQKMESPDLKKALGLAPQQKGVRVRRVEPTAPAAAVLQPSDVILSFDGVNVADDGTVLFRNGERINFSYLVSQKHVGDRATLRVLRRARVVSLELQLAAHRRLIPVHTRGRPPSFFIVAGVVFTPVSVPYLKSEYGKEYDYDAPVKLLDKLMHAMAQFDDEQVIVVSQVLVSDVNIGYEDIVNTQLLGFNGTPVRNLRHLVSMVDTCTEPFLQFELEYQQVVVLETQRAKAATPDILKVHGISSAMSADLATTSLQ